MPNFETPKRFWSKVDVGKVDECWEWKASKNGDGYGKFWINHKLWGAHRVAWILTFEPIPKGLHCCHHCDNRGCCNPKHLFLGTDKGNQVDSARKGRRARKLTEGEVLEIWELCKAGKGSQRDLAEEFGVSHATIGEIARKETWAWL